MSEFSDLVQHTKNLVSMYGSRDEILQGVEDIYLMRDTAEDAALKALGPAVALVKSPDDRNAIQIAKRLLTTTEPLINVPFDQNKPEAKEPCEKLELAARAMIAQSDRFSRKPLHYDAIVIRSAI